MEKRWLISDVIPLFSQRKKDWVVQSKKTWTVKSSVPGEPPSSAEWEGIWLEVNGGSWRPERANNAAGSRGCFDLFPARFGAKWRAARGGGSEEAPVQVPQIFGISAPVLCQTSAHSPRNRTHGRQGRLLRVVAADVSREPPSLDGFIYSYDLFLHSILSFSYNQ